MKHILSVLFIIATFTFTVNLNAETSLSTADKVEQHQTTETTQLDSNDLIDYAVYESDHAQDHSAHALPALWSVFPFVLLLFMIATGPLFYGHFWHKFYPHIAFFLAALVIAYYQFVIHSTGHIIHSFFEYLSFISLLTALYVSAGGILIKIDKKGTPKTNALLLIFGAALANIVGTTGASMLLIRPFMRLNKGRIKVYHVIFFIFMVSNVGGSLTPIGDPPLFLGFLKGIPFEWTLFHVWPYWFFGIGILAVVFYFFDRRNKEEVDEVYTGKIKITGLRNVGFLVITIIAVFIDPNVIELPSWAYITHDGAKLSYLRELIMFNTAFLAFKTSDKVALKGNDFNFEPILEVAFIFVGIFFTMMPALQLIGNFAGSETGASYITADTLYWMTGGLSGVLDNAPTYLNFLSAGMGKLGLDVGNIKHVHGFVESTVTPNDESFGYLLVISISSVFFGAMTYIGNAPNFMVKAIAEQNGLEMPSFVAYIVKYSLPILLPVLFITWLFIELMINFVNDTAHGFFL